jgi:hypothetical protein
MFYSYKEQQPAELPNRIRLSNGFTRTDKSTFTEEEILDAGYVFAESYPSYDFINQKVIWTGKAWLIVDKTQEEKTEFIQAEWSRIREKRDQQIKDIEWRYSRYQRHQRLGLPQLDDIALLDQYVQDLANLPQTQTDPFNIIWPQYTGQLDTAVNQ